MHVKWLFFTSFWFTALHICTQTKLNTFHREYFMNIVATLCTPYEYNSVNLTVVFFRSFLVILSHTFEYFPFYQVVGVIVGCGVRSRTSANSTIISVESCSKQWFFNKHTHAHIYSHSHANTLTCVPSSYTRKCNYDYLHVAFICKCLYSMNELRLFIQIRHLFTTRHIRCLYGKC